MECYTLIIFGHINPGCGKGNLQNKQCPHAPSRDQTDNGLTPRYEDKPGKWYSFRSMQAEPGGRVLP